MKGICRYAVIGIGIFLIPSCAVPINAQASTQNRSTINGYVFGSRRIPVARVPVELLSDLDRVIGRTTTDDSGRYSFAQVPSGRLSIRVLPLGTEFEEQTLEVEISGVGLRGVPVPDNLQKDFYLKLRRNAPASINQVVFAQEIPEVARKQYKAAISDLERQRIPSGVDGLKRAVDTFPTYYLALERLGIEYVKQQKYDDARKSFLDAVKVNARSFRSWYGLAYSQYALKQPEAAIKAAEQALDVEQKSVITLFLLGISQRQAKQFVAAEKSLVQAKKLDGGNTPDIYWNLALLYAYNFRRYKDAANELELYLKANPSAPNAGIVKKLIKQFRENPPSD